MTAGTSSVIRSRPGRAFPVSAAVWLLFASLAQNGRASCTGYPIGGCGLSGVSQAIANATSGETSSDDEKSCYSSTDDADATHTTAVHAIGALGAAASEASANQAIRFLSATEVSAAGAVTASGSVSAGPAIPAAFDVFGSAESSFIFFLDRPATNLVSGHLAFHEQYNGQAQRTYADNVSFFIAAMDNGGNFVYEKDFSPGTNLAPSDVALDFSDTVVLSPGWYQVSYSSYVSSGAGSDSNSPGGSFQAQTSYSVDIAFSSPPNVCEVCQPIATSPPFAAPFSRILSDVGPRNVKPSQSFFHPGIDYAASQGTPIPAVESGFISSIEHSDFGWIVRVDGITTGQTWGYLHIFEESPLPIRSGRFLLDDRPDGQGQFIARFVDDDSDTVDAVYVTASDSLPTILGVQARACVNAGDLIAPVGTSGGKKEGEVGAHLHLGLLDRTDQEGRANPLLFVAHASSDFQLTLKTPAAGTVFKGGNKIGVDVVINSTNGLDLDEVRIFVDETEITPVPERAAFQYGGRLGQDASPSVSRTGETVKLALGNRPGRVKFLVRPLTNSPGLDEFIVTGLSAKNFAPGPHTLTVVAVNISGQEFSAAAPFAIAP